MQNTLFLAVRDDAKDSLHVEVGDSKQPDFKPQFKVMRWDNEVNFSLRAAEHPAATVEVSGEVVKYITPDYEVHQYDKPDARVAAPVTPPATGVWAPDLHYLTEAQINAAATAMWAALNALFYGV